MSEVNVFMCDGPTCTNQAEPKGTLRSFPDWIKIYDHMNKTTQEYHFCCWVCLDQFSNAKLAEVSD